MRICQQTSHRGSSLICLKRIQREIYNFSDKLIAAIYEKWCSYAHFYFVTKVTITQKNSFILFLFYDYTVFLNFNKLQHILDFLRGNDISVCFIFCYLVELDSHFSLGAMLLSWILISSDPLRLLPYWAFMAVQCEYVVL